MRQPPSSSPSLSPPPQAQSLSAAFLRETGRPNYATPTSYLALLTSFSSLLGAKRAKVLGQQQKYEVRQAGAAAACKLRGIRGGAGGQRLHGEGCGVHACTIITISAP